jgi:hypothetical protein
LCIAALTLGAPSGAFAQNADTAPKADGLGYYLPKQVLLLETTTTTETRRSAREQRSEGAICDSAAPSYPLVEPADPPKPPVQAAPGKPAPAPAAPVAPAAPAIKGPLGKLCIEQNVVVTRAVNAQLKLVPDLTAGLQRLSVPGKALADVKLSVELRDGTLLKGLNAGSQGRAGDVIIGVARIAATILSSGILQFAQAGAPPSPTDCNPFFDPFKDQPDAVRLLLSRNASACDAWTAGDEWNAHAQKLAAAVKASEEKLGGSSGSELNDLVARLKEQRKAVDDAKKRAAGYLATVTAMLDDFNRNHSLGSKTEQTQGVDTLELHELPDESVKVQDSVTTWLDLQTDLGKTKYVLASDVLKRAGVMMRLLPMPSGEKPGTTFGRQTCAEGGNDRLDVWFRSSQPVQLQLFIAQTALEHGRPKLDPLSKTEIQVMKLAATRFEPVTFQGIKARCITFKASSFASRELIVMFDERGQLTRVDAAAGSGAAAAVTALASAATTFRDEYAATIARMVDIDANERKLKLSDLTTQVDLLKKERERIDAQLSTDAGMANFDLALEQQKLTAQAAELQAQAALDVAQSTADQKLALEQLKVEIDLVKRELELVKAKQELSEAKR